MQDSGMQDDGAQNHGAQDSGAQDVGAPRIGPDLALRRAREAVRGGDLAEAWSRASAILAEDPSHQGATALVGAVVRRWRGALRAALADGRHGEAIDAARLLLRADAFASEAVDAIALAAPASLRGDERVAALSDCVARASEDSPLWRALAAALREQAPTPAAIEAGFAALTRLPGDAALLGALDDAVGRFATPPN